MKSKKVTNELMKQELEKDTLFLYEKYLDNLPDGWFDCISFLSLNGIDQNKGGHLIVLDEDESNRFVRLINKELLKAIVVNENKEKNEAFMWEIRIKKEIDEDSGEDVPVFFGGENLRKFCDDRNIYYISFLAKENCLMSCTHLKFLKKEGEDCRKVSRDLRNE